MWKTFKTFGLFVLALLLITLSQPSQRACAASYDQNTFEDYGIPDEVTTVLLANSTYADGTTPQAKGLTPKTFTLADLKQLTVVSLANHTTNADGSYTSTVNETVANWVASLTNGTGYNIDDGAYLQNTAANVEGDSGSLANKSILLYGAKITPPFNLLMQLLASASHATTVDLTGITAKVTDSTLVEELLSLFQTDRLSNLHTLILANNNLTTTTFYEMPATVFNVSASQNVTTLDLSDNKMTYADGSFNWNPFPIVTKLTMLKLAGNDITAVAGWLAGGITAIVKNSGTMDLSDSQLDATDYNTLNTMMTLLNAGHGDIKLSNASLNHLIQAVPVGKTAWLPTIAMVKKYLTQVEPATAKFLLANDPILRSDSKLIAELEAIANGQTTPITPKPNNALTVKGNLDFGTQNLGQLGQTFASTGTLLMNAVITKGSTLAVSVAPWVAADGHSQFTGSLILPAIPGYWGQTTVSTSPHVLYANTTPNSVTLAQTISGISMTIPQQQQFNVTSQPYTTQITWTLTTPVSATQQ